jgi:hypothetical protein
LTVDGTVCDDLLRKETAVNTKVTRENIEGVEQVDFFTTDTVGGHTFWFSITGRDGRWIVKHGIFDKKANGSPFLNLIQPIRNPFGSLAQAFDLQEFHMELAKNHLEEVGGRDTSTFAVEFIEWEVDEEDENEGTFPTVSRMVVTVPGAGRKTDEATDAVLEQMSDRTGFLVRDCVIHTHGG